MSVLENNENTSSLQLRQQYYHNIIARLPNFVYLLDKNGIITDCNDNILTLLKIENINHLTETVYHRLVHHAQWPAKCVSTLRHKDKKALLSPIATYETPEPLVIDETGQAIYYLVTRIPLLDNTDNIIGLLVILTDTSTYRQLAELSNSSTNVAQLSSPSSMIVASNNRPQLPPNILLIEDNFVAQKAGQSLLTRLNCNVEIADSGEKASLLFEPGKYDIVFMDIGLEDTSGYVLAKNIRQMEKNSDYHVPIIALTGYEAEVVKYDCIDYFMEGAITKPLTSEQAKQIIQHYIYHIDISIRGLKTLTSRKPII
jgi:CheY-like chemotaxis protein